MPERTGIVTRAGHICMICGFLPTTKNKYRELQDHLVRKHFNDRIKADLPTRRPYMCPQPNCNIEGKDWQALMRHYTGKHGVLEAFLREIIDNGLTLPPNPKHAKKKQKQKQKQKSRLQQQQQQQAQQQQQQQQQQAPVASSAGSQSVETSTPFPQSNIHLLSPTLQPEKEATSGTRKKRPSRNSTGSASSPESLQDVEDINKTQQIALIVKRSLPNGQDAVALIDLKCFLASSTYIPNPEPRLLTAAAGENAHFNVLAEDSHPLEETKLSPCPVSNLPQEVVQAQTLQPPVLQLPPQLTPEQQASPLYPLIQQEISQQQQQLQLQQQQQAQQQQQQQQQDQEFKDLEHHLQVSSQDEVPIHIAGYQEPMDVQYASSGTEVIELSGDQYDQALVTPLYVTTNGEVLQIPFINQGQGEAFQIIQTVPVDPNIQPMYEVQQQHQPIAQQAVIQEGEVVHPLQVSQAQSAVADDRIVIEEVPVFSIDPPGGKVAGRQQNPSSSSSSMSLIPEQSQCLVHQPAVQQPQVTVQSQMQGDSLAISSGQPTQISMPVVTSTCLSSSPVTVSMKSMEASQPQKIQNPSDLTHLTKPEDQTPAGDPHPQQESCPADGLQDKDKSSSSTVEQEIAFGMY